MLKVGIVGLPNVGKSTLFNAILKREQALSANYPFATIEPNVGVVDVIDERLDKLAVLIEKEHGKLPPIVYSTIEFVDIAGLVAGASKGEGLGNQFLANIREVDMIIQVVRDFKDENVIREHSKDPETDIAVINTELILKDLESVEKKIKTIGSDRNRQKEVEVLKKYLDSLNNEEFVYSLRNKIDEFDYHDYIKPLFLLTDKEMVFVYNVDEDDERLKVDNNDESTVFINAKLESELSSLSKEDQALYLKDLGITSAGLDKITKLCFQKLGLISFLTAGEIEVRAWEVKKDSPAPVAAGKIHTDFEKNFIKAEVIKYPDYLEYGSRNACREKGKLRLEGKDYLVQDGDVIEFRIGKS